MDYVSLHRSIIIHTVYKIARRMFRCGVTLLIGTDVTLHATK